MKTKYKILFVFYLIIGLFTAVSCGYRERRLVNDLSNLWVVENIIKKDTFIDQFITNTLLLSDEMFCHTPMKLSDRNFNNQGKWKVIFMTDTLIRLYECDYPEFNDFYVVDYREHERWFVLKLTSDSVTINCRRARMITD